VASEDQVREALDGFLSAFELGDITAMKAAFASNATSFPRSFVKNGTDEVIDISAYRRERGIPAQMRELISVVNASGREPPYFSIEPQNLEIQMYGDVALVTFHVGNKERLGRRTLVMAQIDDKWKIVHLHASNVSATR
jgi:ketosteroid isomerase-like protein